MQANRLKSLVVVVAILGAVSSVPAAPLGTAFTYQGQLKQAGAPLNNTADFQFTLWDAVAGGVQVGNVQAINALPVTAGLFTVALNPTGQFGATAFNGEARWLQIAVRSPAGGIAGFTTLTPRQPLTATPQALFALNAANATNATTAASATNATQLNGQGPSFYQNASNINAGTLAEARLGPNVALLNTAQTFTGGSKTFSLAPSFTAAGAPFAVSSTTKVTNLNADQLDGLDSLAFLRSTVPLTLSGTNATHIIKGENASTANGASGVAGLTTDGIGVHGTASGAGDGVVGVAPVGFGVSGSSETGFGVYGTATDAAGYAGFFEGRSYFSGRVGIGTDDPQAQLHVNSSTGIVLGLQGNGGGQLVLTNSTNDNRIFLEAFNSAGNGSAAELVLTGYLNNPVPLLSLRANTIKLDHSATLTSAGRLHIQTDASDDSLYLNPFHGTTLVGYGGGPGNLNVSGKVGIGTFDPQSKLHVHGGNLGTTAGNSVSLSSLEGNAANGVRLATELVRTSNGTDWQTAALVLTRITDGTRQALLSFFSVSGGGDYVGIGTTTPAQRLDVVAAYDGDGIRVTGAQDVSPGLTLLAMWTEGSPFVSTTTYTGGLGLATSAADWSTDAEPGDVVLRSYGTSGSFFPPPEVPTRLILQNGDGPAGLVLDQNKVGIGTTTPTQVLDVVGNIRSRGGDFILNGRGGGFGNNGGAGRALVDMGVGFSGFPGGLRINFENDFGHTTVGSDLTVTGKVGIGRAPLINRLEVEGNASKTVVGDWLANSDAAIKTNVRTIDNALAVIDRLRPVAFRYTDDYKGEHPSVENHDYYNYIAQEFENVFPDSVKTDGGGLLQMDSYPAGVYAVAAIQELHQIAQDKDCEMGEMHEREVIKDQRINELEARLAAIEALLGRSSDSSNGGAR